MVGTTRGAASGDPGGEALRRALAFATRAGDALASARARALAGAGPGAEVVSMLEARGVPRAAGDLERTLLVLVEQRALRSGLAEAVCAAAAALQDADGGFGPASEPLARRLPRTGMLGGALARTRFARPEGLAAAGDFLARHFAPERLEGFQWENLAGYAHYFANAPHDAADGILQWCGRELERGFRARAFDAVRTARVLLLCDAHGVPGARLEPGELVVALVTEQGADGGFGRGAPEVRVEATLAAMAALRRLGGARG